MKTNNIHDRLKLYELALVDYESSLGMSKDNRVLNFTNCGFCNYFKEQRGLYIYEDFNIKLPELYAQKPEDHELRMGWFSDGEIEPRIECLKKAIELTKQKIHDGQTN